MVFGCPRDAPVQQFDFGNGPISCHAWNKDRTQIAVSLAGSEVFIYGWSNGLWQKLHELTEHDLRVTGIDWGPQTNRIVTCAQDKNAFVWTYDGKSWKPIVVVVRLQRAATCVKWSPLENKIAIGSGSKLVSICFYEKENDWWVSRQIKKPIRSTVSSLDWHPNNLLLAVGSYDFRARVYSAYVKETDGSKHSSCAWATKAVPFGTILADYSSHCGWIHCIRFSPSGNRLCWVGHDSSVHVVDSTVDMSSESAQSPPTKYPRIGSIVTLKTPFLPYTSALWVSENSIVVGGFDCCPQLLSFKSPKELYVVCKLDVPSESKGDGQTAMSMFRGLDSRATSDLNVQLKTLHQNSISEIAEHSRERDEVTVFSTASLDGSVILWPLKVSRTTVPQIYAGYSKLLNILIGEIVSKHFCKLFHFQETLLYCQVKVLEKLRMFTACLIARRYYN
ncbi:WD domain, G-beta repeat protein [Trichuris suis]|nr:WD domain, G-beta repeat protein [Trichuris suis]